jgi:Bifunctional DNA primase/polymerase, N-terminal/Primase C terminal 1 (PriCT-1)
MGGRHLNLPIAEVTSAMQTEPKTPTPSSQAHLGKAAAAYAARLAWPVFPLRPCSKTPATAHGLLDATLDMTQIEKLWAQMPNANIGIPMGAASGVFAFDVDPAHGGDDALRELERRHGELPLTARQLTGDGGEHVLFRHVPGLRNSAGKIGPGLDVRADGGYIVAAPSLHPNRRRYAWDVDHHPLEVSIAEAPAWLVERARGPNAGNDNGTPMPRSPESWVEALSLPCPEGQRNDVLVRLVGHLLRRQVDPFVTLAIVDNWNKQQCKPPLDDARLVRTVSSIAGREIQRRQEAGNHGR